MWSPVCYEATPLTQRVRNIFICLHRKTGLLGDSVPPNSPCELFIDAIEDSEILQSEKDISGITEVHKLINRLEVLQKRIIMLMSAPAMERYEHFTATYPDIVQRVPQKIIASYLGITPEALSTVKRMRLKK